MTPLQLKRMKKKNVRMNSTICHWMRESNHFISLHVTFRSLSFIVYGSPFCAYVHLILLILAMKKRICWPRAPAFIEKQVETTSKMVLTTIPYARSFGKSFFAYHYALNHPHTNIILSWFSIPLVLKCAAKNLNIGLQIKKLTSKNVFE